MSSKNNNKGCFSFRVVLTIIFVVLKVSHVVDWSWLWVLSPLWISFVIGFILTTVGAVVAANRPRR